VPIDTGIADDSGCYPSPNNFRRPIRTQRGSGYDNGKSTYASTLESKKGFTYKESASRALLGHFHFANMVTLADELQAWDELIRVLDPEDREPNGLPFVSYFTNHGDGEFDKTPATVDVGQECLSANVRWGDVNGDGLDDFICLDTDGIPYVSLNRGGVPPKIESIGAIRDQKTTQSKVRLAEIDGDGKLDFCNVERNGVYCWRNSGTTDPPFPESNNSWECMLMDGDGTTLDVNPELDPARTHFIDLNGDGRAD
jgi:hypothetical protein